MINDILADTQETDRSTMPKAAALSWNEANQRYLSAEISALHSRLQEALNAPDTSNALQLQDSDGTGSATDPRSWSFPRPPALEQLCSSFELSGFERGVLLLAAGAEMNSELAGLYASLESARRPLPTLSLALTSLPEAHWSALAPAGALRYWHLIELLAADSFVSSSFRINERILHYLAGVSGPDEHLRHLVQAVAEPDPMPASFLRVAHEVATVWTEATRNSSAAGANRLLPVAELCGPEPDANHTIAAAAAALLDLRLYRLAPRALAQSNSAESDLFLRLWEREAVLSGIALLVEIEDVLPSESASSVLLSHLLESVHTPLFLSSRYPQPKRNRTRVIFYTDKPTRAEQAQLWRNALPVEEGEGAISALVNQFNFSPIAIRSAAHRANNAASFQGAPALWEACRSEARPHLEGLAQRLEPIVTWDDLVLPEKEMEQLRRIALQVRHRAEVYDDWGFAQKSSRGLGISALFAGPSGTGKTTAAEVLAHELRLDLFRIDLSQVISKYIGETEKNLGRVFDAADMGAAVLLFDEADALFGKRTEIRDSHDRYANVEVSYLLQRMEAYRGLAILTSNRKAALDHAFLRRLRFVIEFPFPEAEQRADMWRRIFPARTPTENLNTARLARLRVSGGSIHNIAMAAAFLAADAQQPVRMEHLLAAARSEFAKLEIPFNDAEVAGWI